MEFRNVMIHYNTMVNSKEIDKYFLALFGYVVIKGEVLPEIIEYPIPYPPEENDDEEAYKDNVTSNPAQP